MTRYELPAVVVEHRQRATNQYELILHAPPIAERATPGQFVMLRPMRTHAPLWRRPYSILRANPDKGVFSVFYSVQSAFTELLSLKPIGSTVQTLGPLGSYFVPVRTARRHILAAGGVGAPPLCFFASRLAPTLQAGEQLLILAGARRRDLLVGLDEFRALARRCASPPTTARRAIRAMSPTCFRTPYRSLSRRQCTPAVPIGCSGLWRKFASSGASRVKCRWTRRCRVGRGSA